MNYQVLARKWRPRFFEELIGQDHIVQALSNALSNGRLHHAYLFTGTRGVGKTTIARIFAKTLSCHTGITATPCGSCSACTDIDAGCYVDLVEVDAASRTRVEETRDLLENVQYAPNQGRFKIYLIDEVHMFSGHSFNALLKTLEEPPPHVKFLLATTDPKKLPVTVLSRCLQFNLKHVRPDLIEAHLLRLLTAEGITSERAALSLIAKAAAGSVRDALSLLDQAIAYGAGTLREAEVRHWLGTIDRNGVSQLLLCIAQGDAQGLFAEIARVAEYDPDYGAVLDEMLALLHDVALHLALGNLAEASYNTEVASELCDSLSPEDCQLYYQIALTGRRDLPYMSDRRSGFEMVLLRMLAFQRQAVDVEVPVSVTSSSKGEKIRAAGKPASGTAIETAKVDVPKRSGQSTDEVVWLELIDELHLVGLVRQLAMNCTMIAKSDQHLELSIAPSLSHLRSVSAEARLEGMLQERYGSAFKLKITVADPGSRKSPAAMQTQAHQAALAVAEDGLENDPAVRKLQEVFGAKIEPGSVTPT